MSNHTNISVTAWTFALNILIVIFLPDLYTSRCRGLSPFHE
nr:MAG TPA: hypothetical protein [Caudoviricetes sp.]